MQVLPTELPEVMLFEPQAFEDGRGFFMETYNRQRYSEKGLNVEFVQDNVSRSTGGVLRGLHFQNPRGQGKLVHVLEGAVFDVAVDIRVGSPRFGSWTGRELSATNKRQMYIPPGFAHGFCSITDDVLFCYKCTDFYAREHEHCLSWNDPAIGVEWPVKSPALSEKDQAAPRLNDIDRQFLPVYGTMTS